jgi:hypothetical protein
MKPTPENQYVFSINMYLAGTARQIHIDHSQGKSGSMA